MTTSFFVPQRFVPAVIVVSPWNPPKLSPRARLLEQLPEVHDALGLDRLEHRLVLDLLLAGPPRGVGDLVVDEHVGVGPVAHVVAGIRPRTRRGRPRGSASRPPCAGDGCAGAAARAAGCGARGCTGAAAAARAAPARPAALQPVRCHRGRPSPGRTSRRSRSTGARSRSPTGRSATRSGRTTLHRPATAIAPLASPSDEHPAATSSRMVASADTCDDEDDGDAEHQEGASMSDDRYGQTPPEAYPQPGGMAPPPPPPPPGLFPDQPQAQPPPPPQAPPAYGQQPAAPAPKKRRTGLIIGVILAALAAVRGRQLRRPASRSAPAGAPSRRRSSSRRTRTTARRDVGRGDRRRTRSRTRPNDGQRHREGDGRDRRREQGDAAGRDEIAAARAAAERLDDSRRQDRLPRVARRRPPRRSTPCRTSSRTWAPRRAWRAR